MDMQLAFDQETTRLQHLRLQLAKKNRAIVSLQRQIDNIPDRTELAQYQRRFLELYNQGKQAIFYRFHSDRRLIHCYNFSKFNTS